MADFTIDPNSESYQKLLAGLGILRTRIAARLPYFKRLSLVDKKRWLRKDPLFKEMIVMSKQLMNFLDLE